MPSRGPVEVPPGMRATTAGGAGAEQRMAGGGCGTHHERLGERVMTWPRPCVALPQGWGSIIRLRPLRGPPGVRGKVPDLRPFRNGDPDRRDGSRPGRGREESRIRSISVAAVHALGTRFRGRAPRNRCRSRASRPCAADASGAGAEAWSPHAHRPMARAGRGRSTGLRGKRCCAGATCVRCRFAQEMRRRGCAMLCVGPGSLRSLAGFWASCYHSVREQGSGRGERPGPLPVARAGG